MLLILARWLLPAAACALLLLGLFTRKKIRIFALLGALAALAALCGAGLAQGASALGAGLLLLGTGLLGAELLLPGFSLLGIAGLAALAAGGWLLAGWGVLTALLPLFFLPGLLKKYGPPRIVPEKLIHTAAHDPEAGFAAHAPRPELLGKEGVTVSVLRPSGKVRVEGETYLASSGDAILPAGTPVRVTEDSGEPIRVEKV